MRVLVTGGTGFIGSHSVAALRKAGHSVRLLVRDARRVPIALGPLGVELESVDVATGDVTDAGVVHDALEDCDAVLHAASVYSFDRRDYTRMRRVNVVGTDVVLCEAATEGIDPIVYVSTFGALVPSAEPVLTPDGPVGRPRNTYMATKAEAERMARAYQDEGAAIVITYPGVTIGPHDPHLGNETGQLRSVLYGRAALWPAGGFPIGDVRDVARLHAALMRPGLDACRLIAPSRYVSTREFVETLSGVTGRSLPALYLPTAAMLALGRLAEWAQQILPVRIPAKYGAIYTCHAGKPVDVSATEAFLGAGQEYDLRQSLTDTVRWLYAKGLITRRMAGAAAD